MARPKTSPLLKSKATTAVPPGNRLNAEAQALFDDVATRWELTSPVRALLQLACESITRAAACDAIVDVEGYEVRDMKGSIKVHPLALLSRDLKGMGASTLQRLITNLG